MKVILSTIVFIFLNSFAFSQSDPVKSSIYLIGNTGVDTIPSEAMQLLAFECFDDTSATVVMLGDNVFKDGLNPHHSAQNSYKAALKLISQLELFIGFRGHFYLIAGDRDWSHGKSSGLRAVQNESQLVDAWFNKNSIVSNRNEGVFMPQAGLPGPLVVKDAGVADLIFLDTQWFLHRGFFKPERKLNGRSKKAQREYSFSQLDSLLSDSLRRGKPKVILAHHPIFSNGKHVHTNEPLRSLIEYTPLQIFGLLGLNRYFRQDLVHPSYRRFRKRIERILKDHPKVVYCSAHEHAMEGFERDSVYYLVSGSGAYTEEIDRYRFTAFFMDDLQSGFFKLTFHESGKVYLRAFGVSDRGEYWKKQLFNYKELD
ncbi:MAG: hypothetical protein WED33_04910 [Bacteroidia bacterium]